MTPLTDDAILAVLDAAGLRRTRPRAAIASRLADYSSAGKDFGTEELWHQLQRDHVHAGRATLFRAVDTLVALGVLDRIELADGSPRYRVCGPGHHHHLICVDCHRIEEIDVCLPDGALTAAAAEAGYSVTWHSLELYGQCAGCRVRDAQPHN